MRRNITTYLPVKMPHSTSKTTRTDEELLESIQRIQRIKINEESSSFTIVDCDSAVSEMIDDLADLPAEPPSLYIDLEGIKLSRQGSISILQLYLLPTHHTYLVDVHQLQQRAFSTTGAVSAQCLKSILEAKDTPKVFFDVRNDSDALFHHFHIRLAGVHDIQLMELATRSFPRQYVRGLQKCIEYDAGLTSAENRVWTATKEKGMKHFLPDKGGRYEVFNERPLAEDLVQYCVQDVQFLPRLWAWYHSLLSPSWAGRVRAEEEARVLASQSVGYRGHGRHKALAPAEWLYV